MRNPKCLSRPSPLAIVTGARSGIGYETAKQLAAVGYAVVMVSRDAEGLHAAAASILAEYPGATLRPSPADLTDPAAIDAVADAALDALGRVDALCNVAGDAPMGPIETFTPDRIRRCLDTNLTGVIHLTARVLPKMKEQRRGVIANVSSMAAFDPFPGFAAYAAAKAGLNLFTRCAADEGKDHGVQAFALAPGAVETPMLRRLFSEEAIPREKCLSPAAVARELVARVTGERPFDPGETIAMPSP